jgi:peptidoglycan/LPS O-acetylase OafA/YrhL
MIVETRDLAVTPPATDEPDPSQSWAPPIGYRPGLDGLRALALLSIFVVHADIGAASGAFLAVSTFFTLSGFLITALLVSERGKNGRIDLKAFWIRRARRLLPAAVVAISITVVITTAFGDATQLHSVRMDALAALTYVANWRFVFAGDKYGANFSTSSPLLHFWSLAIEEQFYVVYPLVFAGGLMLWRRWKWAMAAVLGGLLGASLLDGILLSSHVSIDRLYFGTDVRAGELLVGALVAWFWMTRRDFFDKYVSKVLPVAGPVALVAMAYLIGTAKTSQLFWYRGGLVGYAVLTSTAVLAALQPGTLLQRALSWKPLVWVGVTSYGAYLVHWPIFMWLEQDTPLGGAGRLIFGSAASILFATLSFLLIEHPMRTAKRMPRWSMTLAPATFIVIAMTATSIVPMSAAVASDIPLNERQNQLNTALAHQTVNPNLPRVAIFGDSTALSTALGVATWTESGKADINAVDGWTNLGCSILSPMTFKADGNLETTASICTGYLDKWKAAAARSHPDLAVIQVGPWEMTDIHIPGTSGYQALGSPAVDNAVRTRLKEGADALLQYAPRVVLFTSPHIEPGETDGKPPKTPSDQSDPARTARFNEIVQQVAATDPRIKVLDYGAYLDSLPDLAKLRPDGIHLTWDASTEMASGWLGPKLATLAGPIHR